MLTIRPSSDRYRRNVQVLTECSPPIGHILSLCDPNRFRERDGSVIDTAKNDQVVIGSIDAEAKSLLAQPRSNAARIVAVYGLGPVAHIGVFLDGTYWSNEFTLLIEENPEYLAFALRCFDIEPAIRQGRCALFCRGLSFADLFEIMKDNDRFVLGGAIQTIIHRRSIEASETFYVGFSADCQRAVRLLDDNLGAIDHLLGGFKNLLSNRRIVAKVRHSNVMAESSENCPAFLVGSGPSLEINLPVLKHWSEHSLIVACDSSVPVLFNYGISPQVIVTIDSKGVADFYKTAWRDDLVPVLATWPLADPVILARYPGSIVWLIPNNDLIEHFFPGQGQALSCGPAVANLGYTLLAELKVGAICLIGMDFGYDPVDGSSHAKGIEHLTDLPLSSQKSTDLVGLRGYGGQRIFSQKSWVWYKDALEVQIHRSKIPTGVLVRSAHGAMIEGAKSLDDPSLLFEKSTRKAPDHRALKRVLEDRSSGEDHPIRTGFVTADQLLKLVEVKMVMNEVISLFESVDRYDLEIFDRLKKLRSTISTDYFSPWFKSLLRPLELRHRASFAASDWGDADSSPERIYSKCRLILGWFRDTVKIVEQVIALLMV